MRNSFSSLVAAATLTFGFWVGGPTSANAESVMRTCASEWKQAQATGATGGQSWPQFLAQCRTSQASPASTPVSAPAPSVRLAFPWSQPAAPAPATASNVGSGQSVMKLCAGQWKDAKAAGTTGGQTWPQFLAQCRARQGSAGAPSGGFASAPAPAPAPTPAPPSVRLTVSMVETVGLSLRRQARPQLHELANTRPNSPHVRDARRTRSCGQTRRRASTTIRERAITGRPDRGAYMCEADARAAG